MSRSASPITANMGDGRSDTAAGYRTTGQVAQHGGFWTLRWGRPTRAMAAHTTPRANRLVRNQFDAHAAETVTSRPCTST